MSHESVIVIVSGWESESESFWVLSNLHVLCYESCDCDCLSQEEKSWQQGKHCNVRSSARYHWQHSLSQILLTYSDSGAYFHFFLLLLRHDMANDSQGLWLWLTCILCESVNLIRSLSQTESNSCGDHFWRIWILIQIKWNQIRLIRSVFDVFGCDTQDNWIDGGSGLFETVLSSKFYNLWLWFVLVLYHRDWHGQLTGAWWFSTARCA